MTASRATFTERKYNGLSWEDGPQHGWEGVGYCEHVLSTSRTRFFDIPSHTSDSLLRLVTRRRSGGRADGIYV